MADGQSDAMTMDDILVAVAWLENNEGDEQESGACKRAAAFLQREFARRDRASDVRVAKRFRTTPERVAEVMAKHEAWDRPAVRAALAKAQRKPSAI